MTASFMLLVLLPLCSWCLTSATSIPEGAIDPGAAALAAAFNTAAAAGAPADFLMLAASRQKPRLRARRTDPLEADIAGALLGAPASFGFNHIQRDADELEAEALLIDKELAQSERLIAAAWEGVRRAPLIPAQSLLSGPSWSSAESGELVSLEQRGVVARLQDLGASVPVGEWYFFIVCIALVMAMDLLILQHLPEIERTHIGLLVFWLILASAFCAEVWTRMGQKIGIQWASGYLLELIFSFENVFVFNLIFHTLETPRRLMRKALFFTVIGSVIWRFAFILGLAEAIHKLTFLPYLLGAWLIYCGTQQVAVGGRCEEEGVDVTQNLVVKAFRYCLGERFGEFYDEENEAIFVLSGKKACVTLLGAAVVCLSAADVLFGPHATLVKMQTIPNPYINFSSSVLALFTLRALFFVVRDILSHLSLARYCTGIVLLFVGTEMLLAGFTEVSALMSVIVVINVIMLMAGFSAVKDSACPKRFAM